LTTLEASIGHQSRFMGSPSETVCYVWQQIFTTHVQAEVKMYQLRHNISSSCQAVVIMCHLPMSHVTYLLKKETIRQRQHTYTRRDRQTQTDRQTDRPCQLVVWWICSSSEWVAPSCSFDAHRPTLPVSDPMPLPRGSYGTLSGNCLPATSKSTTF